MTFQERADAIGVPRSPHLVVVGGAQYRWWVTERSTEFPELYFPREHTDILRVASMDQQFDIALRIHRFEYGGVRVPKRVRDPYYKVVRYNIFPILVLGPAFPNARNSVRQGARICVRPKISRLVGTTVNGYEVQRLIQWCLSPKFRPVECNVWGLPVATREESRQQ